MLDSPLGFLLYCIGISITALALAASHRLIAYAPQRPKTGRETSVEPVPIPPDALQDRLQAFQAARFASPIVQRQLPDDAGPRVRPVVIPPRRERPFSRPPQPKLSSGKTEKTDNVIPLPLKPRREEPPKEE